ncbi:hypothetical protein [Holospora elegans]|uniref:hypothetical protein n=1 Tax=Holospora elegans TaxID=431043 RepID=UPI00054EAB62|nr:hypothetical protein [Holospora elegans]
MQGFDKAGVKYLSIKGICADTGSCKTFEEFVQNMLKKTLEISARITARLGNFSERGGEENI